MVVKQRCTMLRDEETWRLWSCCWNMAQSLRSKTIWEETYCRKFNLMSQTIFSFFDIESQCFVLSIFRYCEAFPAIKGAIQRVQREKDRIKKKNDDNKLSKSSTKSDSKPKADVTSASSAGTSSKSFTLQRRLSTATPVRYDM